MKNKLTKKQLAFLSAFADNNAIIYKALQESNTKPSELDKWLEDNTLFADQYRMAELQAVSIVEDRLFEIIQSKNLIEPKLIQFYLDRRGGYAVPKENKKAKESYDITLQ